MRDPSTRTHAPLNERLAQSAAGIRAAAYQTQPGPRQDALLAKAKEFAIEINSWLSAPELRVPT
jgi:hypothetical protein